DRLPPALDGERSLLEPVAERCGDLGDRISLRASVVSEQLESSSIELAQPPADGHPPDRMPPEETADDADPHALARIGPGWERTLRVSLGYDATGDRTICPLEVPIVHPLISEVEGQIRAEPGGNVSCQLAAFDGAAKPREAPPISGAPLRDLPLVAVEDGQLAHAESDMRLGQFRLQPNRPVVMRERVLAPAERR